jgi:hypothetical protein
MYARYVLLAFMIIGRLFQFRPSLILTEAEYECLSTGFGLEIGFTDRIYTHDSRLHFHFRS